MFTKDEIKKYPIKQINDLADNIKKLCKGIKVTPYLDINEVVTEYKGVLLAELLKEDRGLKSRYDLLMSIEAKLKFINNTIDLTGYQVIEDIKKAIEAFNNAYNRLPHEIKHIKADTIFEKGLDKVLEPLTINVSETEEIKIADEVFELVMKLGELGYLNLSEGRIFEQFNVLELIDRNDTGKREVNEKGVYNLTQLRNTERFNYYRKCNAEYLKK